VIPDFTSQAWMGFILLGITAIAHIFLINIVLGLAVMIPLFEGIGISRKDPDMNRVSRRLFRYMVFSDLVAGVWATWMVVTLGALWPTFAFTVTRVLFIPLLIGLTGVAVSISTIAVYWYTWDRVSRRLHLIIGVVMAIGALMVPVGFNMIFSFVNLPAGLNAADNGDLYAVFANPIYWVFTPHRIFGAFTLTGLSVAGIYGYKYARGSDTDSESLFKGIKYSLYFGLIALAVQVVLGADYVFTLQTHSLYIFETVFGGLFGSGVDTFYHFLPLFIVFIGLVIVMGVSAGSLLYSIRKGHTSRYASLGVAFSALSALPLIEFVNDASRAPYMIVQGDTGIHANTLINPFMKIGWNIGALSITVALLLTILFSIFLYIGFVRSSTSQHNLD
jgi:cytochrome d ubiquinol oxidase subunit I